MYKSETKNCQNCKKDFVIEPDDFAFYKKIDVPPPTFCPECRVVRRLVWVNDRSLYRRKCGFCPKEVISAVPPTSPMPVYCNHCWWSDKWDPKDYGVDVDFSRPFLEQFSELLSRVPWPALDTIESSNVRSEYTHHTSYLKDCYLMANTDYSEDCAYGAYVEYSRNSFDLLFSDYCTECYEGANLSKCNKVFFSLNCEDCYNVALSINCVGCSDCFGCVNLRNKQYHIFNEPYSKDDYKKKIQEFDLGSFKTINLVRQKLNELSTRSVHRYMHGRMNRDVSGEYIYRSKNVKDNYQVMDTEDSRYCHFMILPTTKDSYDFTMWGGNAVRMYECVSCGGGSNNVRFTFQCWTEPIINVEYCTYLTAAPCQNLFGCIALKKSKNCILNKQYTEEGFKKLKKKVIEHMNKMPYVDRRNRIYKYGEFFPINFSPFAYNETIAQEYFPLTKEQAISQGYRWKDLETKEYKVTKRPEDLPDQIKDVDDRILKETIGCTHASPPAGGCNEQCTTAFKIIEPELQFYRKMNLPLPRLCPNCRHYQRLKQRNPLKLWHRTCQCAGDKSENSIYSNNTKHFHENGHCPNEFETPYSPDRKEIVYCESCYNAEIA
ncbi:MAG: hypothetical protein V2A55_01025 [Candidatus Jorgensenbacteria bacterium]